MKNNKLHSGGGGEYLKALQEEYDAQIEQVKAAKQLTATEKEDKLKKLEQEFKSAKKKSKWSLF